MCVRFDAYIGKEENSASGLTYENIMVGSQLVADYRELIRTDTVLQEAIDELGLDMSATQLRSKVRILVGEESRFIYVKVFDPDPAQAQALSNKVSDVLSFKAEYVIGVKNISILDRAKLPTQPISPSVFKNTSGAGLMGMLFAIFLIFVNMMLNTRISKEDEIEVMFSLPVLGSIPKFSGEDRS